MLKRSNNIPTNDIIYYIMLFCQPTRKIMYEESALTLCRNLYEIQYGIKKERKNKKTIPMSINRILYTRTYIVISHIRPILDWSGRYYML